MNTVSETSVEAAAKRLVTLEKAKKRAERAARISISAMFVALALLIFVAPVWSVSWWTSLGTIIACIAAILIFWFRINETDERILELYQAL